MGLWRRTKRSLGFNEPTFWRQPPMFRFRLAKDYVSRLLFGAGIGLGVGGPFFGILVAGAPPGEVGKYFLLGLAMVLIFGWIAFTWRDMVIVTIALEEAGIRRKTKLLLCNPFAFRDRQDFWDYSSITACGIVPASAIQSNYSILVVAPLGRLIALGIPKGLDVREVAAFLNSRGLKVQMLQRVPPQARPVKSVDRKGFITAGVLGSVGVLLVAVGGVARLAIHRGRPGVDMAAVKRTLETAKPGVTVREFAVPGDRGLSKARISPDGRWVWGLTATGKKHLVWSDAQDAPVGELAAPAADKCDAAFTPDGRRIVLCAGPEVHVWQLQPLQALHHFSLQEQPDAFTLSQDARSLIAISMIAVRLYDLESGKPTGNFKIAPNAVLGATVTPDGRSVVVLCHQRVLAVDLQDGTFRDLLAFPPPQIVYLFGSIARGGAWAAMQGMQGTDVFDVAAKQKRTTIAMGPSVFAPAILPDGSKVVGASSDAVGVWDVAAGKPIAMFRTPSMMQLALSSSGERLVGYSPGVPKASLWEMPK